MFKRNTAAKLKFKIHFRVNKLVDIPLINAILFTQWKIVSKSSQDGTTRHVPINEHSVVWDHQFDPFEVTFSVDKDMMLEPMKVRLDVRQETKGGKGSTRIGYAMVNLSEYCGSEKDISRRYLLLDSKDNSALEITVRTSQTSGPPTFKVPRFDAMSAAESDIAQQTHVPAQPTLSKLGLSGTVEPKQQLLDFTDPANLQNVRDDAKLSDAIKKTRSNATDVIKRLLVDFDREKREKQSNPLSVGGRSLPLTTNAPM